MKVFDIAPVKYIDDKMLILDQTKLPNEEVYEEMLTKEDVFDAIFKLKVRGAPAIGVAAGYGLYLSIRDYEGDLDGFDKLIRDNAKYLDSSRPTAVNLHWALNRMVARFESCVAEASEAPANADAATEASEAPANADAATESNKAPANADAATESNKAPASPDLAAIKAALFKEAEAIRIEDEESCKAIGEHALKLLKPGDGILTHCNAGTIACAKYGTCLSPIYLGQERGYNLRVFADETRPLLQGARLTSWELHKSGVDVTLICDNMANQVMKNGWVDIIFVGCDRMAANGDGANKIGTSALGILAKEHGIPLYMFVPTSTIDLNTPTGDAIKIEERDGEEIYKMWYEKPMAPEGVKTFNPAFDVTPAKYITGIVTEKGIVYPPFKTNLAKLFE